MKAFDVRLNGEQICVAEIDGDGAVNTMIGCTTGEGGQRLPLRNDGLAADEEEFLTWSVMPLKAGDDEDDRNRFGRSTADS